MSIGHGKPATSNLKDILQEGAAKKEKKIKTTIYLPEGLRSQLKLYALMRNKTMTQVLQETIENIVSEGSEQQK